LPIFVIHGGGDDEPFGLLDLVKHPRHRIVGAVGGAHDDPNGAARSHIQLADRIGKSVRAPPLRHVPGIGPGIEHEAARRIDRASDDEFVTDRLGSGTGCCGHGGSPSGAVPAMTETGGDQNADVARLQQDRRTE
jgi:hypothetical protein